ncbi:MAG: hypothetical protein EA402_10005 [Planctomycetota bacterium]|nr:MAG: hypothetical protein EA402_10005 [Planctomycetota bacterium]
MSLQVHCIDGKGKDTAAALQSGKPLRVRCKDGAGREVILLFQSLDGPSARCQVRCEGQGVVELDGIAVQEADLDVGAELKVGRHVFRLGLSAAGMPAQIKNPQHFGKPCSHCQTTFTADDCNRAWMDGDFRICLKCLAKGVRPQHLPQWRHALEIDVDAPTEDLPLQSAIDSGPMAAAQSEEPPTDAYTAPPISMAPLHSSASGRARRRISASAISSVDLPSAASSGGGIIGKVTRVFRRRSDETTDDGEQDRLSELEELRNSLLVEAGRSSLTSSAGLGLPDDWFRRLHQGDRLTLSADDFSRSAIDAWRTRQRQLAHLDAEIAAIRQALGIGSDPALPVVPLRLRTEDRDLENRAFQASDALLTEDLATYHGQLMASEEEETEAYRKPSLAADEAATEPERSGGSGPRRQHHARRRRR